MKKILTVIIIFIAGSFSNAAKLESYRGSPLLCMKVEENILPFGEYYMIRSYRNITQLLISINTKIILYTDRDNQTDSEIFVSSYSRIEEVHLNERSIPQNEFNLAVEKFIRNGDNSNIATIPFPGVEKFIAKIKDGLKPIKEDGEYFIYLKENGSPESLMTINLLWKKLTLRNMLNENGIPSTFYSIYIDESNDRNIKKIIREYSSILKNSLKSSQSPLTKT